MEWMVWTTPTAVFFICIALMLAGMTVWEIKSPTIARRGWLPIDTTRGDRLFIGLLCTAYANLAWVGLTEEASQWWGFAMSMALLAVIMSKG